MCIRDSETVAETPPVIDDVADDQGDADADVDTALAEGSTVPLDPKLGDVIAVGVCTNDLLATLLAEMTTEAVDDTDPDADLLGREDTDPQFEYDGLALPVGVID